MKMETSVVAFTEVPANSVKFSKHLIQGQAIISQEMVHEDKTKLNSKSTHLFIEGLVTNGEHIHKLTANMRGNLL